MEYRICYPDELYHYGVKGMKWGVRKEPYTKDQIRQRRKQLVESAPYKTSRYQKAPSKGYWKNASDAQISRLMDSEAKQARKANKKPMSTAKKVAIGVGVAAAVGGIAYVAVTKRNNKLARAAFSKALRIHGGKSVKLENIKRGPTRAIMEYHESTNGLGTKVTGGKLVGVKTAKLTGHSKYRMTKTGQALSNRNRHASKMDQIVRENARRHASRSNKDWMFDGQPQLRNEYQYHKGEYYRLNKVVNDRVANGKDSFVNTAPVNKLRRQKGPKALRRH